MIKLEPKRHIYSNEKGEVYMSANQILNLVSPKFDPTGNILKFSAKKAGVTEAELQQIWNDKRDASANKGIRVHKVLEDYFSIGKKADNEQDKQLIRNISIFPFKGKLECEKILSIDAKRIAGTADLVEKCKDKYNIWDFKTNEKITFTSDYGNRFLEPLDHLESCEYNKFALQLSLYAYMLESSGTDVLIGQLGIFWIGAGNSVSVIPVPYMKHDIHNLLTREDIVSRIKNWISKNERNN